MGDELDSVQLRMMKLADDMLSAPQVQAWLHEHRPAPTWDAIRTAWRARCVAGAPTVPHDTRTASGGAVCGSGGGV